MAKNKYEIFILRLLVILIILVPLSVLIQKKLSKKKETEKLVLLEYDIEVVDDKFIVERLNNQEKERKEKEEREKYRWPTDSNYYISTYYSRSHDGIDIAGISYGANIYSIYDGEVVTSSYSSTNGNYIVIKDTKGVYSMYAHLSRRNVNQGNTVSKGQIIAQAGSTGNSTGVHLHFSTWHGYPYNGGTSFNPYDLY
ncbi:MAG: M23 family metallopeptidase [Bacilli bacterium]|nr:M23 family metallopeptidase [Bacilli bacterium]